MGRLVRSTFILSIIAHVVLRSCSAARLGRNETCLLLIMLPFSDKRAGPHESIRVEGVDYYYGQGSWPTPISLGIAGYTFMAAAQLAMDHFNARNASVVPELAEAQFESCNVTFSEDSRFVDSAYHRKSSLDEAVRVAAQSLICGVVGPSAPLPSEAVSTLTEFDHIPQLAYGTINGRLSQKDVYPSIVRSISEVRYFAAAVAEYIQRPGMSRDYVAIVYDQTDYGEQFEDGVMDTRGRLNLDVVSEHFSEHNVGTIRQALSMVKRVGYHTVVLVTDQPTFLHHVALIADELGLIGDEWFWLISGAGLPPAYLSALREDPDSHLDRLLRGSAVFRTLDPFVYRGLDDKFLTSWRSQGEEFVDRVNAKHPLDPEMPEYFVGNSSFFRDPRSEPAELASFVYDSVMLVGMSACTADELNVSFSAMNACAADNVFAKDKERNPHLKELLNTTLEGASGNVKFLSEENGRDPVGVMFGIFNIRPGERDESSEQIRYDAVLTSVRDEDGWRNVEGTDFVFFSGSTEQPLPLRSVVDENFLSKSMQIFGLTMMGLALFIAVSAAVWVWWYRKLYLVKAAQPEFLFILCVGAAITAISLLFVSFDEAKGWSHEKLDTACTLFPWFFTIGYFVTYCAIFSKMWRTSKVFSMRRQQVTIRHALWPFAIFITFSIVVLIVWTVKDPLTWHRENVSERPLKTYGTCDNINGIVPYVVPLAVLIVAITVMTFGVAWKTKDIQSEFSESKWIFYGIFAHLETWAIGTPVMYIVQNDSSADGAYLMWTFIILTFSTEMVILVIWPRIFSWASEKYFGSKRSRQQPPRINVSGGGQTHVTGLRDPSTANTPVRCSALTGSLTQSKYSAAASVTAGSTQTTDSGSPSVP